MAKRLIPVLLVLAACGDKPTPPRGKKLAELDDDVQSLVRSGDTLYLLTRTEGMSYRLASVPLKGGEVTTITDATDGALLLVGDKVLLVPSGYGDEQVMQLDGSALKPIAPLGSAHDHPVAFAGGVATFDYSGPPWFNDLSGAPGHQLGDVSIDAANAIGDATALVVIDRTSNSLLSLDKDGKVTNLTDGLESSGMDSCLALTTKHVIYTKPNDEDGSDLMAIPREGGAAASMGKLRFRYSSRCAAAGDILYLAAGRNVKATSPGKGWKTLAKASFGLDKLFAFEGGVVWVERKKGKNELRYAAAP